MSADEGKTEEPNFPPALPAPDVRRALPEPDSIRPEQLGDMFQRSEETLLQSGSGKEEARLLCAACGFPVTSLSERVEVNDSFKHVFMNPAGLVYEIGCFRGASGCREIGEPEKAHTWFPGFSWDISLCRECATHLGWFYSSGDSGFYGLILKKLREG